MLVQVPTTMDEGNPGVWECSELTIFFLEGAFLTLVFYNTIRGYMPRVPKGPRTLRNRTSYVGKAARNALPGCCH